MSLALATRRSQPLLRTAARTQTRAFIPGANFGGFGSGETWPRSHANTLLNVCPQGERMVIERLGKLSRIQEPGWFIAIPMVDQIAYRVDMRERAIEIHPQPCITRDNVSVDVSGNVYVQFFDAELAAYGSRDPLYAVRQHAQSSMRAAIGEMELDDILHARAVLNAQITESVGAAAASWGLEVKRYEITEVTPDRVISEAMDKQAAAERQRRERVLEAQGEKRSMELESEGYKIKLTNESEGKRIQVTNEAAAEKEKRILEAEGEAESMRAIANAQAEAISLVAQQLASGKGMDSAQFQIARDYIEMYGEMGSKSNTMLFSDRPADVNSLMAQAATVLQNTNKSLGGGAAGGSGGGSGSA